MVIHASAAYHRGPHPAVEIDTGPALAVLSAAGVRSVHVEMSVPGVPHIATWRNAAAQDSDGHWSWSGVTSPAQAPAGTIRLDPRPSRAVVELVDVIVCVLSVMSAALGLRYRHRLLALAAATIAVLTLAIDVFGAGATQSENLGVAGVATGFQLNVLNVVTLLPLVACPAAIGLCAMTWEKTRPKVARPVTGNGNVGMES